MYFKEGVVDFKEEKRKQKINIKENKKFISEFNKLLDIILADNSSNKINQTCVFENENSIFYIRKINKMGMSYYSLQKRNKNTDYQFEYFYGNAMVNTNMGLKKIKEFNVTKETLDILYFDLKDSFKNNAKLLQELSKLTNAR